MAYQPIENHGIIGDLHTVALVGMDGSIDFMCFPRFDSPTVFAALLDDKKGGRFQIAPVFHKATSKQLYLPDTNILFTRFLSGEGVAEVSDFMPVEEVGGAHTVVRRARTVRGEVRFSMVCAPRFDYGRATHRVERKDGEVLFISQGADGCVLRLRSAVGVKVENGDAIAEFTLGADKYADFVLEQVEPKVESPSAAPDYVVHSFKDTMNFWRLWISRSAYRGRWREAVNRSALTLKLLTSQPHGSIIAAPTFGLPEEIGGQRNWDYRYTWIRDASFTLDGLIRLGYTDEAGAFMRWLEPRCRETASGSPLQALYGIDGRCGLDEEVLPHLSGYMGSSPVRIGNAAHQQLQLDIYGELMSAVYLYNQRGEPISHQLWSDLTAMIEWVCGNWKRKDDSIWEVRGGPREFLFSRVMCWVALDRAIRLARERSFPAPLDRWHRERDEIYTDLFKNFWDDRRQAFVQFKGSQRMDAAALLMPMMHFISPTDPRWLSTLKAIEEDLLYDPLVYRYRASEADNLPGSEGTFSMCSFWYVECVSRSGDLQKARFSFEKMHSYANHLGLYAEELGPSGEHLGNFPQAFSHLALIQAAYDLDRRLSAAGFTA